jgi:pimeloyl-ACP methyl ester carboxylesterase
MMKYIFPVTLFVIIITLLQSPAAHAQSAQTLLERKVFYQFDPSYAPPQKVDKRLKERKFRGQILWVAKPKPGMPTIYYLPGSAGNLATRRHKFPWMLDRGFGVVAFSYPGMGTSKGAPSRKRIQNLASQIYQKLPDYVADSPILIWGESLGTGVALELATHQVAKKHRPLGIILQAPYTSMVDLVAAKQPKMLPFFAHRRDLWPSKKIIGRIKLPLFIMHGKKDKVVPVNMGRELFKRSNSVNKKFVTHPTAGHTSIWKTPVLTKMLRWVQTLNDENYRF